MKCPGLPAQRLVALGVAGEKRGDGRRHVIGSYRHYRG